MGQLPSEWKHSIVLPFFKYGKNQNEPNSYRPISLTSTLCKIMEKLINTRLSHYLEKNKLITQ